jgi:hypothetical protein
MHQTVDGRGNLGRVQKNFFRLFERAQRFFFTSNHQASESSPTVNAGAAKVPDIRVGRGGHTAVSISLAPSCLLEPPLESLD